MVDLGIPSAPPPVLAPRRKSRQLKVGSVLVGGDARKDLTKPFDFPAALNLFPNTAIDQHVLARNRQFDLIPVIEQHPHLLGIAIDESTAIVVEGNQFSVLGKSYAMVYDAQDWEKQRTGFITS